MRQHHYHHIILLLLLLLLLFLIINHASHIYTDEYDKHGSTTECDFNRDIVGSLVLYLYKKKVSETKMLVLLS